MEVCQSQTVSTVSRAHTRAALNGAAVDGQAHACAAHDLDAVEAALMTTEVYRRFGARDKHLRSLSLRDGDLNGSLSLIHI